MRLILIVAILISASEYVAAVSILCSYSSAGWKVLGTIYDCSIQTASVTTAPNQMITAFTGTHLSGSSDLQVLGLYVNVKTVNYVPLGISTLFSNLIGLEISSCHLKAIEKVDIQSLTKLRELKLNNNDLETLTSGLFDSNTALEYVNFDVNKLKKVGYEILKPLTKLTQAHFKTNTCIDKSSATAAEIPGMMTELNQKCSPIEEMQHYCQKDRYACTVETTKLKSEAAVEIKRLTNLLEIANLEVESLKVENTKANTEANVQKSEIKKVKTELSDSKIQLIATDANLNAATKNLYILKKNMPKVEALNTELKAALVLANVTFNGQIEETATLTEESKLVCRDLKNKTICEAYWFNVRYPETKVKVTDQSHSEIPTSDIETLSVISQQTLFLPNNLAKPFPKLTEMSVVRSGLFEIDPKTLEGMINLTTLNLTENKIREVKADTFKDQTDLTQLDLSFNKIEVVNQGAFDGPRKLKTLLLNDNLLFRIDGRALEILIKLQVLTLNNNILKYISPNLLSAFDELTSADLTNNKCVGMSFPESSLEDIETTLMNQCVAPIDFNCNFRVIKNLVDDSSSYMCSPQKLTIVNPKTRINSLKGKNVDGYGFSDVTTLMISDQNVEFMPFEMAKTFMKLERIIVEKSKLTKLQAKDFEGLKSLKTIVIRGNKIKSIHAETFVDVPQLEHLDLSSNEIKDLPSGIFAPLKLMKMLKMSSNDLKKLNADVIARKNEIENFIFDSNQLEFINLKVLQILRKAIVIDFSDNICIDEKVVDADKEAKRMAELFGYVGLKCNLED